MPDISMCKSSICPLNKTCHRYLAKPDDIMQTYGGFTYNEETKSCDYYWENKEAKARELANMFSAKLKSNKTKKTKYELE